VERGNGEDLVDGCPQTEVNEHCHVEEKEEGNGFLKRKSKNANPTTKAKSLH